MTRKLGNNERSITWVIAACLLAFSCLTLPQDVSADALTRPVSSNGLVGYWSFNEGTSTRATDFSGNGNVGSLGNFASPATASSGWSAGRQGKGLMFDGVDDSIQVANESNFDFERTNPFTISFWIKTTQTTTTYEPYVFSKLATSGNWRGYYASFIGTGSGVLSFSIQADNVPALYTQVNGSTRINDGQWHHVILQNLALAGGAASDVRIYVDGTLETMTTVGDALSGTILSDDPVRFGWRGETSFARYFQGQLDEFRIYNRAISAAEARVLYVNGSVTRRQVSESGLAAHWKFDEGTSTQLVDFSGNGYAGTLTNIAAPATATSGWGSGKLAKGLNFDGTDDYVSLGTGNPIDPSGDFTLSAWARIDSFASGAGYIVAKNADNLSNSYGLSFTSSSGAKPVFMVRGSGSNFITSSTAVTTGVWHHIVGVKSGSNLSLYVDGALVVGPQAMSGSSPASNSGNLYIGKQDRAGSSGCGGLCSYPLRGGIDDVRMYGRALSAAEISTVYASGAIARRQVSDNGLVAYWKFDEGTSTRATDFSGTGNNGTLTNMAFPATASSGWGNGKVGKGLSFDGSNDYVIATKPSSITGALSACLWVKWTTTGSTIATIKALLDNNHAGSPSNQGFVMQDRPDLGGILQFSVNMSGNGAVSTGVVGNGTWRHVCGTNDGSTTRLYVDGVLNGSTAQTPNGNYQPNITLGTWQGGGRYMPGQIDEVRIYNRALSASEVLTLYQTTR